MANLPANSLADLIAQAIEQGGGKAISDNAPLLQKILDQAAGNVKLDPYGDVGDLSLLISAITDVLSLVDPVAGIPIKILEDASGQAGKSGIGFALGYIIGQIAFSVADPILEPLQHAVANALQTGIYDPNTAARLVAHGQISPQFGASEAAGGNMDGNHFTLMVDDAYSRPDIGTLQTALNLNLITQQDFELSLQKHGYPTYWWPVLEAMSRNLLSVADLALANLRGFMDDATMYAYAKQLGVTAADVDVLVNNTGEPPGPEQLMEALRRGYVDDARFVHGIRQSRVRNEWVDVERALAFSPMTTADAIRAVVENYLTPEQGKQIAMENGLMADHWVPLLESWGRPMSHEQMMTLYHRGQATLDQVKQAMRESDLKDKYIDQAVELGRRLVSERQIVSMVDHAVIDHQTGMKMLSELGYNEQDSTALMALGTAQRATSHKTLTKGDTLTMYEDGLLTRHAAQAHLESIGYSSSDAVQMLDLADYKRKSQLLKLTQKGVEAELRAKHITPAEAIAKLVAAGMDTAQAKTYVDEWTMQKAIATRNLTEHQIIQAISDQIITEADGRTRLSAMGFSDGDITIIFKLAGIIKAG